MDIRAFIRMKLTARNTSVSGLERDLGYSRSTLQKLIAGQYGDGTISKLEKTMEALGLRVVDTDGIVKENDDGSLRILPVSERDRAPVGAAST